MQQYVNNIEDCKLSVFRKVINTGDYKLLLISGIHDAEKANEAWLQIYDEYQDNVISESVNVQFEITKQIEVKKLDYTIIQNCLHFIGLIKQINLESEMFNAVIEKDITDKIDIDFLIELLNKYNFRFDKTKGIAKELDRVGKQSKNILSQIKSSIDKLEKRSSKKSDFDDTIAQVEKFMSFPMPENTTVKKFVSYLNMLIKSQPKK